MNEDDNNNYHEDESPTQSHLINSHQYDISSFNQEPIHNDIVKTPRKSGELDKHIHDIEYKLTKRGSSLRNKHYFQNGERNNLQQTFSPNQIPTTYNFIH